MRRALPSENDLVRLLDKVNCLSISVMRKPLRACNGLVRSMVVRACSNECVGQKNSGIGLVLRAVRRKLKGRSIQNLP